MEGKFGQKKKVWKYAAPVVVTGGVVTTTATTLPPPPWRIKCGRVMPLLVAEDCRTEFIMKNSMNCQSCFLLLKDMFDKSFGIRRWRFPLPFCFWPANTLPPTTTHNAAPRLRMEEWGRRTTCGTIVNVAEIIHLHVSLSFPCPEGFMWVRWGE